MRSPNKRERTMCDLRKCVCWESVCVEKVCVLRKCVCDWRKCVLRKCVCDWRKCVCVEKVCVCWESVCVLRKCVCDWRKCVLRECGLISLSLRIQWARSWSGAAFRFIFEICAFGPSQTRPWRVQSLGSSWIWINPSTPRDSPRYLPILIFKYHYFSPLWAKQDLNMAQV